MRPNRRVRQKAKRLSGTRQRPQGSGPTGPAPAVSGGEADGHTKTPRGALGGTSAPSRPEQPKCQPAAAYLLGGAFKPAEVQALIRKLGVMVLKSNNERTQLAAFSRLLSVAKLELQYQQDPGIVQLFSMLGDDPESEVPAPRL